MRLLKTLCLAFCLLAFAACGGGGGGGGATPPVTDTILPSVAITAPATGSTVQGIVAITATASDDVGVSRVEFYQDGALLGSDGTAPYSFNWNTRTLVRGNYTLTTRAYDAAGNMQLSSGVTVTVAMSAAMSTVVSGTTATGTVSVYGLPVSDAYGLHFQFSMPAGASINAVTRTGAFAGEPGGAVVGADPTTVIYTSSNVGSGEVMQVNFAGVPAGATAADFSSALTAVFDGFGLQIQ